MNEETATLRRQMEERAIRSLKVHKDRWQEHAALNKDRIGDNTVSKLWLDANSRTGVLIAAGPSLEHSLDEIRKFDRATHEIVCVDMALKFLLTNGIKPDYVVCADASHEVGRTLKVGGKAEDIALLLGVVAHPETAKDWQGKIFWFSMMSNVFDKDLGMWMQDGHMQASGGVSALLVPGGNVSSLGLSFLLCVRAVPKVLLFGHDFCWTDESRFYCGGASPELASERMKTEKESGTVVELKDNAGRTVYSNASLMYFAGWFADQLRAFPGAIENRTPSTILTNGGTA